MSAPSDATEAQPAAVRVARRRRWLFWTSIISAVSLLLVLVIAVVGGVWLLRSAGGQQQLLSWLPNLSSDAVQIIEPSGDLRDKFSAKQVRIHTKNADVVIDGLRYELRVFDARPVLFHFTTLVADAVTVTTRPSDEPSVPPENLTLPFVLRVDAIEVGTLVVRPENVAADKPGTVVQRIRGQLALTNDKHTIKLNSATYDALQIAGDIEVGATAPMPLKAQIQARETPANEPVLVGAAKAAIGGDKQASAALVAPTSARAVDARLHWTANVTLSGTLPEIKIDGAVLAADQTLTALATVRPFATVPVTTLNAAFDRFDLRKLQASLPQTSLTGKAVIALDKAPLQIDVNAVNALPGSIDSGRLPVAELTVRANGVTNQPKQWKINAFNARLQGRAAAGTITGSGEWKDGPWAITFDARGVRIQELQTTLPALELNGDAHANGNGGSGIDIAKQPIALKARLNGTALGNVRSIPVALRKGFVGELDAQLLSEKIDLKQLKLNVGEMQLTAAGKAQLQGNASRKTWQIDSDAQWSRFDPFLWSTLASTQSAQLTGSLKATATLPANAPKKVQTLSVQAQLFDSRWADQPLMGKFDARLLDAFSTASNPPRIESSGQARLGGNNVDWTGRIGAVSDALQWTLDAPALNELLATAKVENVALQGRITAKGQVSGGWKTPAIKASFEAVDVVASGTAAALIKGNVQAAWQANAPLLVDVTALRVRPYRASPAAIGDAPPPEVDLTLQGRGTLANHRVTTQAALRQKGRKFVLDSALTGSLSFDRSDAPSSWLATFQPLRVDEEVATTVAASGKQNWIAASTLALRWQRGTVGADGTTQTFSMEPGSASVAGVTLAWDRARYVKSSISSAQSQVDISGRIESFSVAELTQRWGDDNVGGDLQMQGKFKASGIPGTPGFAALVELARVSGDLRAGDGEGGLLLGLRELSLRLKADATQWQVAFIGEGQRLGRAEANASVRTVDTGGVPVASSALTGNVLARMDDLSVWNSLLPTGWRLGGGINGSATLGGTLGEPKVSGGLTLANASLRNPVDGVDITRGQGRVAFDGSTLRLENVSAQAGKGNMRINGQGPMDGKTPFLMNAVFEHFAVLSRVDRRIDISGQAELSLAAKQVSINGKLTVDRGLIDITQLGAPTLSEDVVVVRKSDAQRPTAAITTPKVTMNVAVDLGKDLRLIGRGIETRLAGDLTLTTPGGVLTAVGNIRAEDGRYEAYGQKLNVERSTVRFVGPLNNPVLNILALRPNRDNEDRVGVSITGTALQPRIKLYALPERSDTDKLAMLVLGRNFDELGRDETALIQTAAIALLSGESGGSFSSKLGLDTLSVRQANGSNTKDVVITVGKQISDKVYVGYEQGLAGGAGTVQLIYRISQRITLRAQAGKEDSSLDAILTFRWR